MQARYLVRDEYNLNHQMGLTDQPLTYDETRIVWFSKTLENWKALVITTRPDSRYYEVTASGARGEIYIDTYQKVRNSVVRA